MASNWRHAPNSQGAWPIPEMPRSAASSGSPVTPRSTSRAHILRHSTRLDTETLVSIARSESQQHLLAISKREVIAEPVTDVLLVTGNQDVLHSLAGNAGARFSQFGFLQMIERSEHEFLPCTSKRVDIPRHIFLQLIAKASDEARRKLLLERPEAARDVEHMVCDVTGELHSIFGPASKSYYSARKTVSALHRCGALVEKKIFDFAQSHAFPEVTLALSMLCSLPANVIERGLIDRSGEMPMIFAKALDFSWETAMALLFLGRPSTRFPPASSTHWKRNFPVSRPRRLKASSICIDHAKRRRMRAA